MRASAVFAMLVPLCLAQHLTACMRPQMDDRAIQWSNAIVDAKLLAIGPEVKLGQVQDRRGHFGVLGLAQITYFSRAYTFQVVNGIDGAPRAGDIVKVVRLFSQTRETIGCGQRLTPASVGKEFVLLLRPLSDFKVIVPQGVRTPDEKDAMWIVHLEPRESVSETDLGALKDRISGVRASAEQITPERVDHLIDEVAKAPDNAGAGPAIRALLRLGPGVLPAVRRTIGAAHEGPGRSRLEGIVSELTPPEPIFMIQPEAPAPEP